MRGGSNERGHALFEVIFLRRGHRASGLVTGRNRCDLLHEVEVTQVIEPVAIYKSRICDVALALTKTLQPTRTRKRLIGLILEVNREWRSPLRQTSSSISLRRSLSSGPRARARIHSFAATRPGPERKTVRDRLFSLSCLNCSLRLFVWPFVWPTATNSSASGERMVDWTRRCAEVERESNSVQSLPPPCTCGRPRPSL